MDSIWYNKIQLQVEEKMATLHAKDFKFYKVDYFLALAKEVDRLSSNCVDCNMLKSKIENVANGLDETLSGTISLRREYEKQLSEIEKHISKIHKIYPKQYFLYLYSFLGIVAGLILGAAISFLIDAKFLKLGVILGFTIGLIVGRILGQVKEKQHHTI